MALQYGTYQPLGNIGTSNHAINVYGSGDMQKSIGTENGGNANNLIATKGGCWKKTKRGGYYKLNKYKSKKHFKKRGGTNKCNSKRRYKKSHTKRYN